jgi:hypothetical protein
MPIGTEEPNLYPADTKLSRRIVDNDTNARVNLTGTALDVAIQDQHTDVINLQPILIEGTFTLDADTILDTYEIEATTGHGVSPGDKINLKEGVNFYQGNVLSVAVDTITIDTPMPRVFTTAATCERGIANMNVNGNVTRQIFEVSPPVGVSWDITQLSGLIQDDVVMDSSKFGGIAGLTKGVVLRVNNGNHQIIGNVKTNGSISMIADLFIYDDKAPPTKYAAYFKRRYASSNNLGVALRIDGSIGDKLEIIIQDDLTALESVFVVFGGHVVE